MSIQKHTSTDELSAASPSLLHASLLVQIVGHDELAMHVLGPGRRVHLPQAALCCGVSGQPFCKPNLPREPVTKVPIHASQELQLPMNLCFSKVGLTCSEPKNDLYVTIWVFFLFLSVECFGMNMIISGHVEKYLSCCLGLCWVLWSSLTQRLWFRILDFSMSMTGSDCQILDLFTAFICQNIEGIRNPSISGHFSV